MLNSISKIVRSNQNAVMIRVGSDKTAVYTIFNLKTRKLAYVGTLSGAKSSWNRNFKNSRQYVAQGNHRYLSA